MFWNALIRTEGIRASLILALILNVVFFPALWGGKTLLMSARDAPSIMQSGAYQQDRPAGGISRTSDAGAPAWQSEPWLKIVCDQFEKEHNLPLWNPYSAYGTPLAGAMLAQPFYPLSFLICIHPTAWTYDFLVVGRLLVGGSLTFFFASLFLGFRPSLFAAIAFMLSGYFTLYMDMPHLSVEVLLPGLCLTFELLLRKNSLAAVAGIAAMVLLSAIGGMPESMFLTVSFGCCYFLFRLAGVAEFRQRVFVHLGMAAAGLVLGFALAAFLLLPFFEFMRLAHDTHQAANLGGHARGLDFFENGRASITYLLPLIFGPVGNSILGTGWTGVTGYWGVVQCLFAILALFSLFLSSQSSHFNTLKSLTLFFSIFLALMLLKRFGHPAINWIGSLPLADLIVYPKYLEPLMAFCVAMLAGIGFSVFVEGGTKFRYFIIFATTVIVLIVMFALAGWSLPSVLELKQHAAVYYLNVLAGVLVVLAAVMLLLSPLQRSKRISWALIGLLSIELSFNFVVPSFYLFSALPSVNMSPFAGAPYLDFLRTRNTEHDRVFGREGFLYPNWSGVFGLADVRTLDGMFYKRYMTFIRNFLLKPGDEGRMSGDLADRFTGAEANYAYAFDSEIEKRFLALSSVKYLISGSEYGDSSEVRDEIVAQHRDDNVWGFGMGTFGVGPGQSPMGVFQHAPSSRISYKTIIDPKRSMFEGVAVIKPEAHDKSDGVGFLLEVRTGGHTETLFSTLLNPKDIPADRAGRQFQVDLTPYAGKHVELLFSTDPGPSGSNAYDWAGWTRLHFVPAPGAEADGSAFVFKQVYESEVRIYENDQVLPRASLFGAAEVLPDDLVLKRLKEPSFRPNATVLLSAESLSDEDLARVRPLTEAREGRVAKARIASYDSQRVVIEAETSAPGVLMLNDTNYPGWRATVDGKQTSVLQADYLFRGVIVPAGKSIVEFSYKPTSFRLGAAISAVALVVLAAAAALLRRRKRLYRPSSALSSR